MTTRAALAALLCAVSLAQTARAFDVAPDRPDRPEHEGPAGPAEPAEARAPDVDEPEEEDSRWALQQHLTPKAGLNDVMRALDSASSAVQAYQRRLRASVESMSHDHVRRALGTAAMVNGILLVLYAPLTSFVCLVTGRLRRSIHATFAALSGLAIITTELPQGQGRARTDACRWLTTQVGRTSALVFASTVTWGAGPLGAAISLATALNAALHAYSSAIHPAFQEELREVAAVGKGFVSIGRQLLHRLGKAITRQGAR